MSLDVLITGGGGMLAWALKRELAARGYALAAPGKHELDVTDEQLVRDVVRNLRPRIIIQCAAYTRVDDAESHEDEAYRVNALGTKFMAEAAREVGARFVYPSTDYVFDGTKTEPYRPDDAPNPINAYGRTKLAGEEFARLAGDYVIVRLSWLYGPGGRNFVRTIAEKLERGEEVRVVNDQFGRPTWTVDAAKELGALLTRTEPNGIVHCCCGGIATWFEIAREIARCHGRIERVTMCTTGELPRPARRPARAILECSDAAVNKSDWPASLRHALAVSEF